MKAGSTEPGKVDNSCNKEVFMNKRSNKLESKSQIFVQQNEVKEQKKYKDTVFRLLFSDKRRALSLYNGIHDTDYQDESLLEFNTLKNAIYMNLHNDISFVIVNQIHLYEHQSTLPVNLPLRDLLYIADILQKTMVDKTIYSSKRLMIPNPNFVVFYNGQEKMQEHMELKLSDSFLIPTDNPELELKVTVLNINAGMNERIKEKCPALKEYMQYVDMVREYNKEMPLKDAVVKAVDECIEQDILGEFLTKQKAEVVKMSIYEFDEEREMRLIREDEREIGREEGMEKGREEGRIKLERILALNKILLSDNRIDDLKRAVDDEAYREVLCEEYCI